MSFGSRLWGRDPEPPHRDALEEALETLHKGGWEMHLFVSRFTHYSMTLSKKLSGRGIELTTEGSDVRALLADLANELTRMGYMKEELRAVLAGRKEK